MSFYPPLCTGFTAGPKIKWDVLRAVAILPSVETHDTRIRRYLKNNDMSASPHTKFLSKAS